MNIIEDFWYEIYSKSNHIITLDNRNSIPIRQLSARRRPPADATLVLAHSDPCAGGYISLIGTYLQERGNRIYNGVPGNGEKERWGLSAGLPACAALTLLWVGRWDNEFVVCCCS